MNRPVYESETDRRVEQEIADAFAARWKVTFWKMRPMYPVDRALLRNDIVVAWAEIKRRHRKRETFRSLLLSAEKAAHGVALSTITGIPFLFLVRFDDCDTYVRVEERHMKKLRIMGRSDRGDEHDREPCIEIDTNELKVCREPVRNDEEVQGVRANEDARREVLHSAPDRTQLEPDLHRVQGGLLEEAGGAGA